MKTIIEQLIDALQQEIKNSARSSSDTIRTGDYRIGLRQAIDIACNFLEIESKIAKDIRQLQKDIILPRMAELHISKYKLAKLTGLAESTITRWFNGERGLSLESFFKVTKALDLILIFENILD